MPAKSEGQCPRIDIKNLEIKIPTRESLLGMGLSPSSFLIGRRKHSSRQKSYMFVNDLSLYLSTGWGILDYPKPETRAVTVERIPDRLQIPLRLAGTFAVDGAFSARDISYGLTAAWLAGQRDAAEDDKDLVLLDNGFRLAMGRSRRNSIAVEEARVRRLTEARVTAAGIGEPVALPTLPVVRWASGGVIVHRGGIRIAGDAQQQWQVNKGLTAAMRVGEGDEVVELPRSILQHARGKVTVQVMLRILAMVAGQYDSSWIRERHDQVLVLQVPFADLVEIMGLPEGTTPKAAMSRYLTLAGDEITKHTDYRVRFTERRTVYKTSFGKGPQPVREGKLQGLVIHIEYPVIETPVAFPEPRVPYSAWKPKPQFKRPPKPVIPEPAFIENIVPIPVDDDIPVPGPRPTFTAPAGMTSRFGGFGNRNR